MEHPKDLLRGAAAYVGNEALLYAVREITTADNNTGKSAPPKPLVLSHDKDCTCCC